MLNDPNLQYTDDEDDKLDSGITLGGPAQPGGSPGQASVDNDAVSSTQAAPLPASGGAPKIPMLTADDLNQAQAQKQRNLMLGGIGDSLANMQSAGNFFLGHMNPHQDVSGTAQQANQIVDQGVKNKELLQKQALQAPELQYMQNAIDPNSDASKTSVQLNQALLKKYAAAAQKLSPDLAQAYNDAADKLSGQSAFDADKTMEPFRKIMSQEDIQGTKNQIMAAIAAAHLGQGDKRIEIADHNSKRADDAQAAEAAAKVDSNPLIQSSQRQLNQINIDKHTLQSTQVITPQMVHEIGAGIAAALNQGKSVGLGQMEMQDMATSQTKLAQIEQMILNKPENGASPEIKQQMLDTLDRLGDSYAKVQGATAKKLAVGRNYSHNAAAQSALSDKVQTYQPQDQGADSPDGAGVPGVPSAGAAQGFSPADRAALDWAQANSKDPRSAQIINKLLLKSKGQ